MTEQHGKLLTCLPFSYLSLSMEPFFFLVYNNGSISVPIPPKCHCGMGFSSSLLMALSLNVTSSVHFSYNPTSSKSLWEWKTKEAEEKNGGKIRNKGHLTYRAIFRDQEAPEITCSVPGQQDSRRVHPDLKLALAANCVRPTISSFKHFQNTCAKQPATFSGQKVWNFY